MKLVEVEVTRVVTETEVVTETVTETEIVTEEVVISETARGEGRQLTVIFWQAPSNQMPYLSGGGKELDTSAIVLEPLARYNPQGQIYPVLAQEVPTLENGGFSEDLMSITWTLKEGLLWSDGTPVTSADLAFTYEFCSNPETGCSSEDLFRED